MDFLKMDFSLLFKEKHGDVIYNNIYEIIKKETSTNLTDFYVSIIFKIALLDFWGLKVFQIQNLLNDYYKSESINVEYIQITHKKSINEIKKYLNTTILNEYGN